MGSNKGRIFSMNWNATTGYKPTPWKSTVLAPACALCAKAVFPAEEVIAAGQKFHKLCLKCSQSSSSISLPLSSPVLVLDTCSTLLNTGNVNEHEKKIYCVGCYRRQFGPRGGSFVRSGGGEKRDCSSRSWSGPDIGRFEFGNTTDQSECQHQRDEWSDGSVEQ